MLILLLNTPVTVEEAERLIYCLVVVSKGRALKRAWTGSVEDTVR
jgi:hypothetical protein